MSEDTMHREPRVLDADDLDGIEARVHDLEDGDDARYVTASQVRDLVHNLREARMPYGRPDDHEIVSMYSGAFSRIPRQVDGDPKHVLIVAKGSDDTPRVLYRGSEFDESRHAEMVRR